MAGALALVGPWVAYAADSPGLGTVLGAGAITGSAVFFGVAMGGGRAETSTGLDVPMATLVPIHDGRALRPGLGVSFGF